MPLPTRQWVTGSNIRRNDCYSVYFHHLISQPPLFLVGPSMQHPSCPFHSMVWSVGVHYTIFHCTPTDQRPQACPSCMLVLSVIILVIIKVLAGWCSDGLVHCGVTECRTPGLAFIQTDRGHSLGWLTRRKRKLLIINKTKRNFVKLVLSRFFFQFGFNGEAQQCHVNTHGGIHGIIQK